jgi:hypothetical protein
MKKTIINRNYSLLVLILLVLYVTYIIIPNNTNMMGGSSPNPFDSMDETKLTTHLMKTDSLFNILNKYFTIYIAINVILILASLYFAYFQYAIQGIPAAGIQPVTSWDNSGATFLTDFFLLSRQKLGLNPPNITINPDFLKDFDNNAINLVSEQKPGVDLFCNIISPCDICGCTGPDPNYAGDVEDAPIVPYGGPGCVAKETFMEGATGSAEPAIPDASVINNYKDKFDYSHRILGNGLPNCCCHLFKKYNIPSNWPSSKIDDLMKLGAGENPPPLKGDELEKLLGDARFAGIDKLPSLGLPNEIGCEPEKLGEFKGNDGKTVKANNGNYALAMFQSCLSNKPNKKVPASISSSDPNNNTSLPADTSITNPNDGKTPYDINIKECFDDAGKINDKRLAADKGISQNFVFRNELLFDEIKKGRKSTTPSSTNKSLDMTKYIGNFNGTWWKDNAGPAWPFNILFPDPNNSVSTQYYYTYYSKRYELKIDNHLQEVYVDPQRKQKNKNCTIEIIDIAKIKSVSNITITQGDVDAMKKFIEFGLEAKNDETFMDFSKNPPIERKTASKKRYIKKKGGKFIFP